MKSSDFASIVVYILMFTIALFIGLQIIQPANIALDYNSLQQQYTFAIAVIIIGILVNVIIFEIGHVIGALIGGYKILSVNILGFCLYRTSKGFRFGFRSFEGLTGETRILAKRAKSNPRLYLFGPTLLTVVEFVIAIFLFVILPETNMLHHAALIVAGIGAMLLVYNIMPFKLDTMTDGYHIIMLSKKVNIEAYNELIRIESLVFENKSPTDIKVFDTITTMTARVNMYKVYEYIDDGKLDLALEMINKLITNKDKIESEIGGRAVSQKLYILLVTKPRETSQAYFYDELNAKDRKFISNDVSMESLRAYLLYSGLVEKSESECEYVLGRLKKALKLRMDHSRRETELNLFRDALQRVRDENPSWQLEDPLALLS